MFNVSTILERLKYEEGGFYPLPYRCTAGVWTQGFGATEIDGQPVRADSPEISYAKATTVLKADVLDAIDDCQAIYGDHFDRLHPVHQEVLICMAFQLGRGRLEGFVKMNDAIGGFDYRGWLRELKDSKLFAQTPTRVNRMLEAIRMCEWPPLPRGRR